MLTMLYLWLVLVRRMARSIGWSKIVGVKIGVSKATFVWSVVPISVVLLINQSVQLSLERQLLYHHPAQFHLLSHLLPLRRLHHHLQGTVQQMLRLQRKEAMLNACGLLELEVWSSHPLQASTVITSQMGISDTLGLHLTAITLAHHPQGRVQTVTQISVSGEMARLGFPLVDPQLIVILFHKAASDLFCLHC